MVIEIAPPKFIEVEGRKIAIGGPKPDLREGEKLIRYTSSVCPECYRLLPAVIFERDGKVYIRKVCPEHGEYEELYWGDAELFKRALKFEAPGRGLENPHVKLTAPCPFSCGICNAHLDATALANLVVTNRCDLSCWYCFFYAEKAGYVYEPTLEQIEKMIDSLINERPAHGNAVQITGGEPTLRDDLIDIVKLLKRKGVTHIQLNTHGITFMRKPGLLRKLREAGVNTIYMSFDGVTPETNPKNHWEIPYILEEARRAGMTSIVLVPTVIKGINDHEVGDIIRFAALNIDVIRGVNFQPVSLTGQMPRKEREKYRITIPDVIKRIEEQTNGEIYREAWYPVPFTTAITEFIEALTGKPRLYMGNHPACGAATYVFPEFEGAGSERRVKRFVPITDFVDVDGFYEFLKEKAAELKKGKRKHLVLMSVIRNLGKYIYKDRQPEGVNFKALMIKIFLKRGDYSALGEFHYKSLFLGMMHFMDLYNYDVQRVMRCNIHYLSPDGRIIPFCTYNVMPDLYRDKIIKEYSKSFEEFEFIYGKGKVGDEVKYKRNIVELENTELYVKTYKPFFHRFRRLPRIVREQEVLVS